MAGRLQGKVAVVTGAADGLGKASALRYAREGAQVVLADINLEKAATVAEEIGSAARAIRCDVSEESEMQAAVELAMSEFGGLDTFLHLGATPGVSGFIHEISVDDWDKSQAILVRGSMLAVKVAVPALRTRGGGSITLTSSAAAFNIPFGNGWLPGYLVGKTAVSALGRVAALQYGPDLIRVNTLVPGAFNTSAFNNGLGGGKVDQAAIKKKMDDLFNDYQPIKRAGMVEDIASAVVYLASDDASFVTGTDHFVDGGLALYRDARNDEAMEKLFTG